MAGKAITVSFYEVGLSKPLLEVDPRWWDAEALCADPRFQRTNESGSYYDWSADLTVAQFRELHEGFRAQAKLGVFFGADWQAIIQPRIKAMDEAIGGALGKIARIHVQVAEWESGLGD